MVTESDARRILEFWQDPFAVAPELTIKRVSKDEAPKLGTLHPLQQEQVQLFDSIKANRQTFVVKARRTGVTTAILAYLFARSYNPGLTTGVRQMSVCNDPKTMSTCREITERFHDNLIDVLQNPRLSPKSKVETGFPHNGSVMERILAGGKGQGRSGSVSSVHFTEMAFYSSGTSARGNADTAADEDVWQSIVSTMDDPTGKIIVESTGNGPFGKFYDLYRAARDSDDWGFLFFPWHEFPRYQLPFADDLEKVAFDNDLSRHEKQLRSEFGLTLEQLKWRRYKFEVEKFTMLRFRREYPLTDIDPFLLEQSNWFDQDALNGLLAIASGDSTNQQLQIYHDYDDRYEYFMGVDTSGGTGRDEAVIQIIRSDMVHVLTWRSNTVAPHAQAHIISRLGAMFGGPMCLIEANSMGIDVIEKVERLGGVRLWTTDKDKPFCSTGGQAGNSKEAVYIHAREMIESGWVGCNHPETLRQAQAIVETPEGKIEAATGNDDLIDAFVFALWAGRRRFIQGDELSDARATFRRRMEARQDILNLKGRRRAA